MAQNHNKVSEHYTVGDIKDQIFTALESAGKDLGNLTVDDLAPVDEFHLRGRTATEELVNHADIKPEHHLLDVGCGLGGTSRYLAAKIGCSVVGVDLTEEYCRVAETLSAQVGLEQLTTFHQGSALDLPFPDSHFDVVWTEHVQMNIKDKNKFYSEIKRVLKPGGKLAFHDIFGGSNEDGLEFPVPWATDESISHLIPADDLKELLSEMGLEQLVWEDKTEQSKAFLQSMLEKVNSSGWMPLGLHLLIGDQAVTKFSNVLNNLEAGKLEVLQAVMKKA